MKTIIGSRPPRVVFIILAGCFCLTATAEARDSTWLVCSNDSLALSSHEHRAPKGDGRETALTLIFGVHEMRGMLKNVDSGAVTLRAAGETGTKYVGKLSVNYAAKTVRLAGTLTLQGAPTKVKAILQCKEMSPDL